jgi:hypothetical protein
VVAHRQPHAGVLLLRLGPSTTAEMLERVEHVLNDYAAELDQLVVVTKRSVRVRRTGSLP